MANLFIIGNGFDLAHKMKTNFNQFRDYLDSRYPEGRKEYLYVPGSITDHHGEEIQNEDDVVSLIVYLLNQVAPDDMDDPQKRDWSEIEYLLGKLNLSECFENVEPQYDREGDRIYSWEHTNAEIICGDMALAISRINDFLLEWICNVKVASSPLKQFAKMINPNEDLFFSFNYTQTLEKLYGCSKKNICHIHGMVDEDSYIQRDQLILGHCGQINFCNEKVPYEMENDLQSIYESLRKDTAQQISLHKSFFRKIHHSEIEKIYSFGFAFADVDLPYIKKICGAINTQDVTWYLNNYDNIQKRKKYKSKLQQCGFQGRFGTFTAN